ncbi:carotenoid oxygenase family protein [Nocardia sp. R16R-3T]
MVADRSAPADDRPGGDGYLVTDVSNADTGRSDLVILDAFELAAPPLATVHRPARCPTDFRETGSPTNDFSR